MPLGILRKAPRIFWHIFQAKNWPERTHRKTQRKLELFKKKAQLISEKETSITTVTEKLLSCLVDEVFFNTVPLFILGKSALTEMKKIAGSDLTKSFAPLEAALKNNVTTQMGLDLYDLSMLLPQDINFEDIENGLAENNLPKSFILAWKKFIASYGFRGPAEIDVAAPRYCDDHKLLFKMLFSMKTDGAGDSPTKKFRILQNESRKSYEYMHGEIKKKSISNARNFEKKFQIFDMFAGYRETHKLYLAFVTDLLRKKTLQQANLLCQAGLLQTAQQVFDLQLEQIDEASSFATSELISLTKENRKFTDSLARVSQLPSIFDSRGMIIRPPIKASKKGVVVGTPISAGIARGPIKILHAADEKPFLKGDILVARATDPGWTPLFVSASAVILEIGGVLQHGALVAREYGLPCVAGVENATELWKDGDLVEVDGMAGTIRLVKKMNK